MDPRLMTGFRIVAGIVIPRFPQLSGVLPWRLCCLPRDCVTQWEMLAEANPSP